MVATQKMQHVLIMKHAPFFRRKVKFKGIMITVIYFWRKANSLQF